MVRVAVDRATRLGWAMTSFVALVTALAGVVFLARWWRHRRHLASVEAGVRNSLPAVVELIVVVLGAGGSVHDAVRLVAERGPLPVRASFAAALARSDAGVPLASSLAAMSDDLDGTYRALVASLVSTERDGAPISSLILRLGDEARVARRRAVERRSKALPVQLLLPLVCCSLPAVLIGGVLPLVVVAIGRITL